MTFDAKVYFFPFNILDIEQSLITFKYCTSKSLTSNNEIEFSSKSVGMIDEIPLTKPLSVSVIKVEQVKFFHTECFSH